MGVVFRALDTKLQREVALKLLPDHFAADPERLARFQREAQVLASLNHPNIAQIYGLEESGNTRCIVMELVEGETLQERLKRGSIPIDEALPIAKQIAEALEAAHESGLVHRDLKPANIKLAPDGRVKVLDFGLAKAFAPMTAEMNLSNSPTLMSGSMPGVILGTAAYMSPEQAKGKEVDRRADIWAFGVVVYEMLTGERMFEGETISDTLAQVLTKEPDLSRVPAKARKLLARCLQKDPKQRLRDIGEARFLLDETAAEMVTPVRVGVVKTPWIAAAVATLAAVALGIIA